MENKKNKFIILFLVIIIIILSLLCTLLAIGKIKPYNNDSSNNKIISNNNEISQTNSNSDKKNLNQGDFKKLVNDELYILFGFKSLKDVTNDRKLTLTFNKIENEHAKSDNNVYVLLESVSKEEVEKVFNETCFSKLGINHEKFDVFELNDSYYNRNNQYMSKRNLFHSNYAYKIKKYEQEGNKYTLAINYLFPDTMPGPKYYYGSYSSEDQNENNKIVKAYEDGIPENYINSQEYLDNNYEKIKDKLDTYNYIFEVNNNKIEIVDFYIN